MFYEQNLWYDILNILITKKKKLLILKDITQCYNFYKKKKDKFVF